MNPIALIKASMNQFTKKEQLLAEAIVKDPLVAVQVGLEEYAQMVHSSKSAYIRMCQKLGYKGYTDFRFSLSNYMISTGSKHNSEHPMQAILNIYSEYILRISEMVKPEDIAWLAKTIVSANRIKILGINRTGLSAQQLRMRIMKLGYDAEAVNDAVVMRDLSDILATDDLCIIFSIKATQDYLPWMKRMKENGATVVLITMTANSPLHQHADQIIRLPFISRSDTESFLDDQAVFFVLIEVLLNELARMHDEG